MRRFLCCLMCLNVVAAPLWSKPLLTSSEDTYVSACIADDDSPARLIEICHLALEDPGASQAQRVLINETLAYAYYDEDMLDQASALFQKILSSDPASHIGYRGLGWIAHQRDNYAEAAKLFQQSVDLKPSARALAGLADSQWETGDADADHVLMLFDAALAISPDYSWAERAKGWVMLDDGRDQEALEQFQKIVNKNADDQNAIAGLLKANRRFERYEMVLDLANKGLALDPDSFWFLNERSYALFKLKRYRQAIQDGEALIALDPKDSDGHVIKARAMAARGARGEALSNLAAAENEVGADDYLIYWRASIMLDDLQYEAAKTQIMRNVEQENADKYDFTLLTLIDYYREDYAGARAAVDRALELDARGSYAIYYDAMLMLVEEKPADDAISRFDDAMNAGLPDHMIAEFAKDLIGSGYVMRAIAIRAKYAD